MRHKDRQAAAVALPLEMVPDAAVADDKATPLADAVTATTGGSAGRARLRPLLALAPYVARYRGRALLALVALVIAAVTTLIVPVAVPTATTAR